MFFSPFLALLGLGRCCNYLNHNLDYKHRIDLSLSNDIFKVITVEVNCKARRNILLSSMYRAPDTDVTIFNEELDKFLSIAIVPNKALILCGDFNLDLLKIEERIMINDYFDVLMSHQMLPTVTRPTRVTEFTATLIDNFFVNSMPDSYHTSILYDDLSDHFPILIHINMTATVVCPPSTITKRLYNNKNNSTFIYELSKINWNTIIDDCQEGIDTNLIYDNFLSIFSEVFNACYPICQLKTRQKKNIPGSHVRLLNVARKNHTFTKNIKYIALQLTN